jgi:hypothetical protein
MTSGSALVGLVEFVPGAGGLQAGAGEGVAVDVGAQLVGVGGQGGSGLAL